jgi:REP element-mobilizing transposase RayT
MFGEIIEDKMKENQYGKVVRSCWSDLPSHYTNIHLDEFIIMPNHVHGIINIIGDDMNDIVGGGLRPPSTPTNANGSVAGGLRPPSTLTCNKGKTKRHGLPEIVRAFKLFSSRRINEIRKTPGVSVWQQNYYEHIIRNENELHEIRQYIVLNPLKWELDLPHEIKESSLLFRISYERNRVRGE